VTSILSGAFLDLQGLGMLINLMRRVAPQPGAVFPAWQGMQYTRDMFSGGVRLDPLDNDRFPGMTLNPDTRTHTGTSPTRGQARQDAILDAAAGLVVELGYERVTVDAIAARRAQGPGDVEIADTGTLRGDLLFQVVGIANSVTGDGGPSLVNLIEAIRTDADFRDLVRTQIEAASAQAGRPSAARIGGRRMRPPS